MALQFPPILVLYALGFAGAFTIAYRAWAARPARGAGLWALMMFSAAMWAIGQAAAVMVETPAAALLAVRFMYLGIVGTVYFWGLFTLRYSYYDQWLGRPMYIGLAIVPTLAYGAALFGGDAFHRTDDIIDVDGYTYVTFELGSVFWVWSIYAYSIIVGGAILLLRSVWRYPHLYRGQTRMILLGVLTPLVLNILHLTFGARFFGPYDPTVVTYALSGLWFLLAITRFRFLDITPVAHDLVFRSVNSGVIILDSAGIITDINPSAAFILKRARESLLGESIAATLPDHHDRLAEPPQDTSNRLPIELDKRHYEVQTMPLYDRRGQATGRVVMLYDVTPQTEAMYELAQRDAILGTLVESVQILLQNANWATILPGILASLGASAGASRVYIFEKHADTADITSQTYEWVAPGISPEIDNPDLQGLSLGELFPRWLAAFQTGESIQGQVKDFPESERAILEPQDIVSIMVMPILVHGAWWGFIGFDECLGERVWLAAEQGALRSAANSLGAAIERQAAEAERERLIEQLRAAQAAAEENVRVKTEFLATMSHELRTPLNAIEGFTSIMLSRLAGVEYNAKAEDFLLRIQGNSQRLIELVTAFLDLTRIEAGHMSLHAMPFAPREQVTQWQQSLGGLAEAKGLTLRTRVDPRLPATLWGDPDAISKIVANLLSNAIKFTSEGSVTLAVELDETPPTWRIVVSDTGIGIPPEAHELIFEEFRQADGSSTREHGGTGLGLAIVHKLVHLMEGQIAVQSEVGAGSTFSVTLPLRTEPQAIEETQHV
ncbi:MAG: histidine kinase N-terminal 7TM domain-containing protein [Anaerolineales bacterium]